MARPFAKKFNGKSRTKQSFRDECDINYMLKTYQRTGKPMSQASFPGHYGDFTQVPDFHAAQNQVIEAQASFDLLPSAVRSRFQNDPAQLIEFLSRDENREEAVELGLVGEEEPNGSPTTPEAASPATPNPPEPEVIPPTE